MLTVQEVTAGYGAGQVLFGIDLRISAGEIVTLLGRNGMGKTTLVRAILGLLPYGGDVRFMDRSISGWSADRIARAGIGVVPEGRQCFPNLTVLEHLTAFQSRRNPQATTI